MPTVEPRVHTSIIIVSYNTREMTLACIRSVLDQAKSDDFEIIVLDNASTDGSAAALREEFGTQIRLFAHEDNVGFAGGNNLAAEHAQGEFLLLLNPDTVVLDHAIDRLVAFSQEHPDAGIWGGRTVFEDGSLNPASCWRRTTLWSLLCQACGFGRALRNSPVFNPEGYGGWPRDTIRRVDIVSGCFFLIRRDMWKKLEGFDLTYFMYGEEADLCHRARALGANPIVTPNATIVHYGGASEKVRAEKVIRLFKAKSTLIRRHWVAWKVPFGIWLLSAWPLSRAFQFRISRILGRTSESSKAWAEVWQRRREWIGGYERPSHE